MNNKPLIVNFFGGPGTGKSTTAAHTFAKLKWDNLNIELVTEYAKDKTWEGSFGVLENQIYVFGKQQHKMYRVSKHVDIIVTDSPLLTSLVYGETSDLFKKFVIEEFNKYNNLNILLKRSPKKMYIEKGRTQTEGEAIAIDGITNDILVVNEIPYTEIEAGPQSINQILKLIYNRLISTLKT